MSNILLTRQEMGSNVHFITRHMENIARVKSGEALEGVPEWVIRWGCTARIPNGPKILNKIKAIKETTAKGTFRKKVADAGHAMKTWLTMEDWFVDDMHLPVIIRPIFHQRSEDLFFCRTTEDVRNAVRSLEGKEYYISEYINKTREWRVFIAQGRVMIVAEKIPEDRNAVTWGCVDEGDLEYVGWGDWNLDLIKCAIESFNLTALDFGAVDIVEDAEGNFFFLEMNTAPEVWVYYGQKFADVFNYIIKNDKRDRLTVENYDNWRNLIHPAISNQAIVA